MQSKMLLRAALTCCALSAAVEARADDAKDKPPFSLQDAIGSDSFKIKGSERIRYESYDNGYRPTAPQSADLLTFRTSIAAEYDGDGWRVGGELRDVRGYLTDKNTPFSASDVDTMEPVQLYAGVSLGDTFGKGSKTELVAGRMLLNFGSKRLVGDPGFLSTANAFTGVRLDWKGAKKQTVTIFYTLPDQRLPDDKQSLLDNKVKWNHEGWDTRLWGAFATFPAGFFGLSTETYLFGLDEDDRPTVATRNRHLITPGFRLYAKKKPGKLDTEVEAAYQFGTIRASTAANAARLDVSAYTVHAELGYTIPIGWSPRVALLGELASGDHAGSSSYNRFDYLYGPRFTDWGPTGLYGALGRTNIVALGARLDVKPSKRFDFMVQYHDLWLDSATDSFSKSGIVDATGQSGRHAGGQVDGRMRFRLIPGQVELDLGGAMLIKGEFLDNAPNHTLWGDTAHGYADLILSF